MVLFRFSIALFCSIAALCQGQSTNTRGIECPDFRYVEYSALDQTTEDAAMALGYSEGTWNTPGTQDVEELSFSTIVAADAADEALLTIIGFTEVQYDCYVNHYEDYSWAELATEGVQEFFVALGWTEDFLGNGTGPPASEDKGWSELTAAEQTAAGEICYFEELWDGDSLLNFGSSAHFAGMSMLAIAVSASGFLV